MEPSWISQFARVNKDLWVLLSVFVLCAVLNYLLVSEQVILGLYVLPTLFSAYFYGRRHATLTAAISMTLAVLVLYFKPPLMMGTAEAELQPRERWFNVAAWGGILVVTAYAMGSLYERKEKYASELRETYHGVLMILRHFVSKDKYTENHSYRVSVLAAKIAAYMGFDRERIEDVRTAALLHDIGKLDISREVLYKAARLTEQEYEEIKKHVEKGIDLLQPVGGSLRRIIPIILAHHDKFDGSGYHPTRGEEIPVEARIISVADVYDSLASDRPYRKAMSPFEARDVILKGAGKEFDPKVVEAFLTAFQRGELEIPEVVV